MNTLRCYYEKRKEGVKYARWLFCLIRPWLWRICLLAVVNGLASMVGVGIAAINKRVVDAATASRPSFDGRMFAVLVAATFCSILFSNSIGIARTWLNERFSFSLKEQFYGKLLQVQWLPLSRLHSGDVMTRLTGDIETIASGIFGAVPAFAYIVFQLVTAFGLLYHFDPMLAVFALCLGPAGALLSLVFGRLFARFQRQSRENESAYRAFMQESVENLVVSKSFCMEGYNREKMRHFWKIRYGIIRRRSLAGLGVNAATSLLFTGGSMLAFGWSLMRLARGEITYGTVTLLLTLVSQVQNPIQSLQSLLQQMISVLVSAGRIMEIGAMPEEKEPSGAIAPPREVFREGLGIRGKELVFSYQETGEPVLRGLCFEIAPGETVGIVGSSGAGKTTIIRLLLSLIYPRQGELVLYDRRGNDYPLTAACRPAISYVPQGNTLMSGTVRENLLAGKADATEEEMWRSLAAAEAEDFVRQLPLGLDSVILEKGGAVSEGQAQRIAIARAIIKPAAILILDEATASLDMETEARIVQKLREQSAQRTCIVVTHRPSLLGICQRTLGLEDGRLVEL